MISLLEILHTIGEEKESGLVCIDDWRWPDVDHLKQMGFDFNGDYKLTTNKPPIMSIYKKKEKGEDGKEVQYFYLEETKKDKKDTKRFKDFENIINYFDTYSQPDIEKNI
jgi:hypothetical protein